MNTERLNSQEQIAAQTQVELGGITLRRVFASTAIARKAGRDDGSGMLRPEEVQYVVVSHLGSQRQEPNAC